jgi:hypothetical protein
MRTLFSCAIVFGLTLGVIAAPQRRPPPKKGDKAPAAAIEKDLLAGIWKTPSIKGLKGAAGPAREFTKDGNCYLGTANGKGPRLEGTYEVDNDTLTIKWAGAPGVPGEVQKFKIKKLTKTDLILAAGKLTETWKRAK